MSKISLAISLICIVVFTPVFFMYLNIANFNTANISFINSIQSDDFNFITLSGFGTILNFFIELGKFSIINSHPIILLIFVVINLSSIVLLGLIVRGV